MRVSVRACKNEKRRRSIWSKEKSEYRDIRERVAIMGGTKRRAMDSLRCVASETPSSRTLGLLGLQVLVRCAMPCYPRRGGGREYDADIRILRVSFNSL